MSDNTHAEHPFAATHSLRYFYVTEPLREILRRLDEGLGARGPFLLVTGEPGSGKTALALEAAARWGSRARVVVLANPAFTRTELVEDVARRFGATPPAQASKPQLLALLDAALTAVVASGKVPVVVIDDAHLVADELIEELCALANAQALARRAFEVVLAGLPALDARLATPAMTAVRQRLSARCALPPLTHKETRLLVHHRVAVAGGDGTSLLPRKACAEIHEHAQGNPRLTVALAAEAMRVARAAGVQAITPEHVREAAATVLHGAPPRAMSVAHDEVGEAEPVPAPEAVPARDAAATSQVVTNAAAHPVVTEPAATTSPTPPAHTPLLPVAVPPPVAAEDAALPEGAVATLDGDPESRVRDWVTRFVGDQGPPKIGSRVRFDAFEDLDVIASRDPVARGRSIRDHRERAAAADPGDGGAASGTAVIDRDSDDTVLEELYAPRRRAVAPKPPAPRARGRGKAVFTLLGVILLVVAAVLLVPNLRESVGRGIPALHLLGGPAVETEAAPAADPATRPEPRPSPAHAARAARMTAPSSTTPRNGRPESAPGAASDEARSSGESRDGSVAAGETSLPGAHTRRGDDPAMPDATHRAVATAQTDDGARQRLALEVASFYDRSLATSERDRISSESGLKTWIARNAADGAWHVVAGVFSTSGRAQASADILLERGIVTEAHILSLPPAVLGKLGMLSDLLA